MEKENKNTIHFSQDFIEEGGGFIFYRWYDDGVLVFMGAKVKENERCKGLFKKLVSLIMLKFTPYKEIQICVSNPKIIPFLERLGFKKTDDLIRYWGRVGRSINMKKVGIGFF